MYLTRQVASYHRLPRVSLTEHRLASDLGTLLSVLLCAGIGLGIPTVSSLCLVFLGGLQIFSGRWHALLLRQWSFVWRLGLLIGFCVTYLVPMFAYGYTNTRPALESLLVWPLAYIVGGSLGSHSSRGQDLEGAWQLVALVSGFAVFSWLSARGGTLLFRQQYADLGRAVPNPWTAGTIVGGPAVGIMGSLGFCLVPALFLMPLSSTSTSAFQRSTFRIVVAVIAFAGGYGVLRLQERGPLVALAIALLVAPFVGMAATKGQHHARRELAIGGIIGVVTASVLWILVSRNLEWVSNTGIARLMTEGIGSARFSAWRLSIQQLLKYPMGGRQMSIAGLTYVHNGWLDVAYSSGIVPFIVLLAFHVSHIRRIWHVLRDVTRPVTALVLSCILVALLGGFAAEPVIDASMLYFAASCFILGFCSCVESGRPMSLLREHSMSARDDQSMPVDERPNRSEDSPDPRVLLIVKTLINAIHIVGGTLRNWLDDIGAGSLRRACSDNRYAGHQIRYSSYHVGSGDRALERLFARIKKVAKPCATLPTPSCDGRDVPRNRPSNLLWRLVAIVSGSGHGNRVGYLGSRNSDDLSWLAALLRSMHRVWTVPGAMTLPRT